MKLTKQQINTILKSDTVVFRHIDGKGFIECVKKPKNDLFEQRVNIEVESSIPSNFNKACHVDFFYQGQYKVHNNLLFFLKSLKSNNDVALYWDSNGKRTDEHKDKGFITETLYMVNNELYCEIHTTVKLNNSANMIK
jgi:hypothetical protein